MKYKSVALPERSSGVKFSGKKLFVPDQSLSVAEILARFQRDGSIPNGERGVFIETDEDLEKLGDMDLVEKDEFIAKQKAVQEMYKAQEAFKAKRKASYQKALDERANKARIIEEYEESLSKLPPKAQQS